MIKYKNSDILDASENIICHQVNCQGVMGAGLAKQIKDKNPQAYLLYKNHCKYYNYSLKLLGTCFMVQSDDKQKIIANIFAQDGYGNGLQTDYDALEIGLLNLKECAKVMDYSIAIPYKIGCGLANGNWNIVFDIINRIFDNYDVTIYKLNRIEE
jgi:O-acetyl-ADP-ribose deacetylase (regulator of RNase III)